MNDKNTYFDRESQEEFIDVFRRKDIKNGENFPRHWHEHLQIYYFTHGIAALECGMIKFKVQSGDIVAVNSNELHYLESLSDDLDFYIIRFTPAFLFSNQVDLLQAKYLTPITLNRIAFKNLIGNDNVLLECIQTILNEYSNKKVGYELSIKANIYQLIVLLLRRYICKIYTKLELEEKKLTLTRLHAVFEMIDKKYCEKITLNELADSANLSVHHFCRTFKQLTGKTTTDYINGIRLNKAVHFLNQTDYNMTEIALKCGFENINYFSRLFKKYYSISPSKFRNIYKT